VSEDLVVPAAVDHMLRRLAQVELQMAFGMSLATRAGKVVRNSMVQVVVELVPPEAMLEHQQKEESASSAI
jgi:hypothetical protein